LKVDGSQNQSYQNSGSVPATPSGVTPDKSMASSLNTTNLQQQQQGGGQYDQLNTTSPPTSLNLTNPFQQQQPSSSSSAGTGTGTGTGLSASVVKQPNEKSPITQAINKIVTKTPTKDDKMMLIDNDD
jgi:hypothetical protein